jgi:hypothetical protein
MLYEYDPSIEELEIQDERPSSGDMSSKLPDFEGKHVATTKVRLASTLGLDINNVVLHTDDIVRIVVEARVTGISHQVNERSGDLERIQTLKAIEVTLTPWDEGSDEGVLR